MLKNIYHDNFSLLLLLLFIDVWMKIFRKCLYRYFCVKRIFSSLSLICFNLDDDVIILILFFAICWNYFEAIAMFISLQCKYKYNKIINYHQIIIRSRIPFTLYAICSVLICSVCTGISTTFVTINVPIWYIYLTSTNT